MYRCVTERTREVDALTVLYNGHSCFVAVKIGEKLGENSELTRCRELAESFVAVRERLIAPTSAELLLNLLKSYPIEQPYLLHQMIL